MRNLTSTCPEDEANPDGEHLTDNTAPVAPNEPTPSETSEGSCRCRELHSEPSSGEAGPRPEVELPVKTPQEKIFQAFNYLDTRWDPSQWLGLGAILFHLTDGSEEGQDLFDYWSFYYHPDYDDSEGVSQLWEWFAKGGRGTTSMQTIRCFMAAGFALDQLVPQSPVCAADEDVPREYSSEEGA